MNKLMIRTALCKVLCIVIFLITQWSSGKLSAQDTATRDTMYLKEVEVFGNNLNAYPVSIITPVTFNTDAIRDIGDFLRQQPNVSGIRKGGIAIDPVIRGFKYNQVTVLLNSGVKIEGGCPNRMDPVASHVESENISKIEIIKGPYVLKYGPVMGAMVNLITQLPHPNEQPGIHGEVLYGFESNWNGQREHVELAGGNNKIFFNVSGGYKGYGNYKTGNEVTCNSSFKRIYGSAAVGYMIKKNQQLSLSYTYDEGKDVMYPALPMDEQIDQTHIAFLNYSAKNAGRLWKFIEFQSYFSSVHHVMDNLKRPAAKTMQALATVDAKNAGGKLTGIMRVGNQNVQVGIDYEHISKDGQKRMTMDMEMGGESYVSVKNTNLWLHALYDNAGAFAEYKIPVKGIDMAAALRLDYNQASSCDTFQLVKNGIHYFDETDSKFLNVSFSLGLKKQIAGHWYFNAAIGRGTRSPSMMERFIKLMPVQYDAFDYLGNPGLKPEKNHQVDASFDFVHSEMGTFSVGGFFSLVSDYIRGKIIPPSVITPSTQGAPGVKQFVNTDMVYLKGFEATYRSPAEKKWELLLNAAATYGTEPEAVKYIVSDGQVTGEEVVKNDPLSEIPPLEVAAQFSYKLLNNTLIPRMNVRLVSKQNRISQSYGELETPGFATAAVSATYTPFKFASLIAGINNIFDTPYYEHLNRRIIGSMERLYEPGRVFYVTLILKF